MPVDYSKYPPDWKDIRERILKRSGHKCEGSPSYPDCRAINHQPHPITGSNVVLTIAHLDHDSDNWQVKATTNKKEFLKSEYKDWTYWQEFSYAEFLRTMKGDEVKCKCGVYYWDGFKRPCNCPPS